MSSCTAGAAKSAVRFAGMLARLRAMHTTSDLSAVPLRNQFSTPEFFVHYPNTPPPFLFVIFATLYLVLGPPGLDSRGDGAASALQGATARELRPSVLKIRSGGPLGTRPRLPAGSGQPHSENLPYKTRLSKWGYPYRSDDTIRNHFGSSSRIAPSHPYFAPWQALALRDGIRQRLGNFLARHAVPSSSAA